MENNNSVTKKPTKYWLVEFTLTSGEILEFYIKARTYADAIEKADEYTFWVDDENLKNHLKQFKLMV